MVHELREIDQIPPPQGHSPDHLDCILHMPRGVTVATDAGHDDDTDSDPRLAYRLHGVEDIGGQARFIEQAAQRVVPRLQPDVHPSQIPGRQRPEVSQGLAISGEDVDEAINAVKPQRVPGLPVVEGGTVEIVRSDGEGLVDDVEDAEQWVLGNDEGVGIGEEDGLAQPKSWPQVILHCLHVLPECTLILDAKGFAAIEVAEGASVVRAAFGGLENQGHVLIRWQDADRRVDGAEARRVPLQGGEVVAGDLHQQPTNLNP